MFNTIEFTKEIDKMKEWFPLMMTDRMPDEIMAANRIARGTEVNYGELTRLLFGILETHYDTKVQCHQEVLDIDPKDSVEWAVKVKDIKSDERRYFDAKHVFIGAGGGSILLLQKVEIAEKHGYGGFPVGGDWLVCNNQDIIKKHHAKVYSKAELGAPPMSEPHLDSRLIDGKQELIFGPFASFSPKFLKEGSFFDLAKSVKYYNIPSMLTAFWHNLPLTKYLVDQVKMSHEDRMEDLRKFIKDAKSEDWEVLSAGQRVQIIKKDEFESGKLQFGTEVVSSKDGRITCLLGASPGASIAPKIMLDVLGKAFPELIKSEKGQNVLDEMVPTWNKPVTKESFEKHLESSKQALHL